MPHSPIEITRTHGDSHAIACRNGWPGNDAPAEAAFTISYDDEYLKVSFTTTAGTRLECRTDQGPVSADSCVEFFMRPEGSDEYWNFEFNCAGVANASHRRTRPEPVRLTAEELASIVRRPEGDVPDGCCDTPRTWRLAVAIPWRLTGIVPAAGTRFKANVYACASKALRPYYMSFAPIATEKPDFHRPEHFVDFILR